MKGNKKTMARNNCIELGVIGGSGLYKIDGLKNIKEVKVDTPFGKPSDSIITGEIGSRAVAFLPRHGRGHVLTPSEINYRANIYALKKLGVKQVISVSACGSLKEELKPMHMVFPDQLFDRTHSRVSTFFGGGVVGHVGFADPFCGRMQKFLADEAEKLGLPVHRGGTYVCIEGPMFSTRAESNVYRQSGFSVIGMTNLTEAKLAREAEICYSSISLITDYDVWKADEEVSVEKVMEYMSKNVHNVKNLLQTAIPKMPSCPECACQNALKYSVITAKKHIKKSALAKLKLIIGRYIK